MTCTLQFDVISFQDLALICIEFCISWSSVFGTAVWIFNCSVKSIFFKLKTKITKIRLWLNFVKSLFKKCMQKFVWINILGTIMFRRGRGRWRHQKATSRFWSSLRIALQAVRCQKMLFSRCVQWKVISIKFRNFPSILLKAVIFLSTDVSCEAGIFGRVTLSWVVLEECPCSLLADTNGFGLGGCLTMFLVFELHKTPSAILHRRTLCHSSDFYKTSN
jgi:hypothetical protein